MVMLLVPAAASAQVVISEIMYDLPGSDSKAEWIELQNVGTEAVDISKWKLNDGSNHTLNAPPKNDSSGSLVMQPGAFLILASDAATFRHSETVGVSVIDTVMSLGNNGGSISLFNASSTLADTVSYSKATGASGTGESLQKVDGDFAPGKPTPGAANSLARIERPVASAKTAGKPGTKAASKVGKIDPIAASTSEEVFAQTSAGAEALTGAAIVPLGEAGNSYVPWVYGALAAGIAGAGVIVVARQKKRGEWEIEEIA